MGHEPGRVPTLMSKQSPSRPVMPCAFLAQRNAFVATITRKVAAARALRHLIMWSHRELSERK